MPKLFLLCEFPTLAGGERSMLSILAYLQQHGYQISVIAPEVGPLGDALRTIGVPILSIDSFLQDGKKRSQAEIRQSLAECLKQNRPDILHANSLSMGRLAGPVCQELQIKSVAHLRDIIKLSGQAIDDLNCHTRLLAVSQAVKQHHVAQGLSEEKTKVLHNGVDLEIFQPSEPTGYLHRELNLPIDASLIAIIGQICLRKGLDVFAEAATLINQRHPELHFLVVGSRFSKKQESCELEQRLLDVANQQLQGKLHLLGERTDVDKILKEATILIHASRQEPLGRVLLEASATGVPVVATDVGGTCEIFPPAANAARIVEVDRADQIAAAVDDLLQYPEKRKEISHNARVNAETRFAYQRSADGMLKIYQEILDHTQIEG